MNDSELESRLRSVPVPERSEEYWNDFPVQLRLKSYRRHPQLEPDSPWPPRYAWVGGLALALVLVFVSIQFHVLPKTSAAITRHEQHLRAQMGQIEFGMQLLIFNPHGMTNVVNEPN